MSAPASSAAEAGIDLSIGVVLGDDLSARADDIRAGGQTEMFSGVAFPDDVWSMNAYLGARPIAAALASASRQPRGFTPPALATTLIPLRLISTSQGASALTKSGA